jgi:hypothetical protein
MDTIFWGPDCWKLLHNITQNYPTKPSVFIKQKYKEFFINLKNILPCVYCRKSLNTFMEELPIDNFLKSKKDICLWLYLIHNKVNDKLRSGGQTVSKNPKFESIYRRYQNQLKNINSKKKHVPGIDFMYSIVFNYVFSRDNRSNKCYKEYVSFFNNLKYVLPFKHFKTIYKKYLQKYPINKNICNNVFKLWMFGLEEHYNNTIFSTKKCFNCTCNKYDKYKAKCAINTCRT